MIIRENDIKVHGPGTYIADKQSVETLREWVSISVGYAVYVLKASPNGAIAKPSNNFAS